MEIPIKYAFQTNSGIFGSFMPNPDQLVQILVHTTGKLPVDFFSRSRRPGRNPKTPDSRCFKMRFSLLYDKTVYFSIERKYETDPKGKYL